MALISNPAAVMFSAWDTNYDGFKTVSGTFKRGITLKCQFISFWNMCVKFHKTSAKNWQESVTPVPCAGQGLEIQVPERPVTFSVGVMLFTWFAVHIYSSVGCSLFLPLYIFSMQLSVHSANRFQLKLPWPDLYLRKCTCNEHNSSPPSLNTFFLLLSSHKQNDMRTIKWLFLVSFFCRWKGSKYRSTAFTKLIPTVMIFVKTCATWT